MVAMSKKIIAKSGGQLQPERPGHFHPEKGGQFHPEKAGVLIRNIQKFLKNLYFPVAVTVVPLPLIHLALIAMESPKDVALE